MPGSAAFPAALARTRLTTSWAGSHPPKQVRHFPGLILLSPTSAGGCGGRTGTSATVRTTTRSSAELLPKVRTGSRHALRGTACRLSLCVVHRGPAGLQDGPGCATPAVGDPCRTRTCIRCVRGSRRTDGRTGRGCRQAKGEGFETQGLTNPPRYPRPALATSAAPPADVLAGQISNGRPLTSDATPCCATLSGDDTGGQIQTDDGVFARSVLSTTPPESDMAPRAPPLCVGPRVRGTGVKPVPIASRLRPGAIPPRQPADGNRCSAAQRQLRGHRPPICWRSLQLSRCYLGDTNQDIYANELAVTQEIEPRIRPIRRAPG